MPDSVSERLNHQLFPDELNYKAISEKDMAFLSELYASTRWKELEQTPWNLEQKQNFLQMQFDAQHKHYQSHYPKSDYLLILYKTQEIGRIYLDRDETSICLIDIAFLPEFRNRGFGTQILKNLINEAQSTQKKITIHVENFNPAYNWYAKLGFQQVEDKGVYQYMEWYPKSR